ncbi:DUF5709 domain-containing protein [Streptomyces sp. NPDC048639]|uniref:DUF5709 domain-containing protein n=1 Tax=Streptomyces sp. NPDC048639 TaxID=3365581 RepID=UPI003718D237
MSDSMMGDEVYQPDGSEQQDDVSLLEPEDTLDTRGVPEVYEEGYSPPDRPWAVETCGTTAGEQHDGESLEGRLSRETPDLSAHDGDAVGDVPGGEGEPLDQEVGEERAGRLVAPDEGAHSDEEKDLVAQDIGIDGAAASAEEAAVHVVNSEEPDEWW